MTNQTFDFNRYVLTLKKELVENKKQLLIVVLSLFSGLSILMFFGNILFRNSILPIEKQSAIALCWVLGVFGIVVSVFASLMFNGLRDKTERVNHLMSPASVLEKFLVQLTIYLVGGIVAFFVCAQLADLVRIALMNIFVGESNIVPPINFVTGVFDIEKLRIWPFSNNFGEMLSSFTLIVWILFSFALYMLGAALWPKLSFLKTLAATYVIQMVFMFAFSFLFLIDSAAIMEYLVKNVEMVVAVLNVVYLILTVLYVVASYVIYRRKDVISNSWL